MPGRRKYIGGKGLRGAYSPKEWNLPGERRPEITAAVAGLRSMADRDVSLTGAQVKPAGEGMLRCVSDRLAARFGCVFMRIL